MKTRSSIMALLILLGAFMGSAGAQVRNVVLVHGAWADGSSWAKVIPLLEKAGLNAVAVQNPLTSFDEDVATTKRAIALQDGPVILVGHSWGGVVITEVGADPKVAGLVYVAAFAPEVGVPVGELGKDFPPPPGLAEARPDAEGYLTLTRKGVFENFAPDLPAAQKKLIFATQGATNSSVFGAKVANAGGRPSRRGTSSPPMTA
jgi:pimeloyl-ACP methyl ester carboxylesterase